MPIDKGRNETRRTVLRTAGALAGGLAVWSGTASAKSYGERLEDADDVSEIHIDFDDESSIDRFHWGGWNGDADIVDSPAVRGGALRVTMHEGTHRGYKLQYRLDEAGVGDREEFWAQYYLRFDEDFSVICGGGKLPGPCGIYEGGAAAGEDTNGTDSWSARGGFRPAEDTWADIWGPGNADPQEVPIELTYYAYHADTDGWGDQFPWDREDAEGNRPGWIDRGQWYRIDQYVRMNTPGENDGVLRAWVDGDLATNNEEVSFRDEGHGGIKVNRWWLNLYYGGNWTSPRDNDVYIDEVRLGLDGPVADDLESPARAKDE